nr:MAG TPA: hypothetical protein [Caudoviricetes sp.]
MKTNRKLAVYYKYRDQEIDIRNKLLDMFDLYEDYRESKYKSVGNYLSYKGYQAMADRIIYQFECGTEKRFNSMMSDIYVISNDLHDDLKRLFEKNYSHVMLYKRIIIALRCATHLTR